MVLINRIRNMRKKGQFVEASAGSEAPLLRFYFLSYNFIFRDLERNLHNFVHKGSRE